MKLIKKIAGILVIVSMVFVIASCGGSKGEKAVKKMEEYIEKVKEAKTMPEIYAIQTEAQNYIKDVLTDRESHMDEYTAEDVQNLVKATSEFDNAFMEKQGELLTSSPE